MKKSLRAFVLAAVSFSVVTFFYPGFEFASVDTLLVAAPLFSVLYLFVKPILNILSLPLNIITFGLSSLILNIALLFFLALIIPGFDIVAFMFEGWQVNRFFSALAGSVLIGLVSNVLFWLLR